MRIAVGIPTRNEHNQATLKRGEKGFRLGARDWRPDLIENSSDDEDLVMSPDRCEVVYYIRSDFAKTAGIPEAQALLKHLQAPWDERKASHRHPYQLLRRNYGQQAGLMACTRIPPDLMLDV